MDCFCRYWRCDCYQTRSTHIFIKICIFAMSYKKSVRLCCCEVFFCCFGVREFEEMERTHLYPIINKQHYRCQLSILMVSLTLSTPNQQANTTHTYWLWVHIPNRQHRTHISTAYFHNNKHTFLFTINLSEGETKRKEEWEEESK